MGILNSSQIMISAGSTPLIQKTSIDISGKLDLIEKSIAAVYKAGYDELEITFNSSEELQEVHRVIGNGFIGYEIVDEKKNKVIIKAVSALETKEFEPMLRRCFLFILSMGEELKESIEKQDKKVLSNIRIRDNNVNKITDFLRRALNKTTEFNYNKPNAIYCIIEGLEKIGDSYKEIATTCIGYKDKTSNEVIELVSDVNTLLRQYYNCFFNFKMEDIASIKMLYINIKKKISHLETKKGLNIKLIFQLESLSRQIYDLSGVLMLNYV